MAARTIGLPSAASALVVAGGLECSRQSLRTAKSRSAEAWCVTAVRPARFFVKSFVRCEASDCDQVREAVDRSSKEDLTKDVILRNQNGGSLFDNSSVPGSGLFFPRPEIERRPETGDRSFGSLFCFDGAAPETINGRLAMLGFIWALAIEKDTGLTVLEQVFNPGTSGLVNFVGLVQLVTFASFIPFMNGESTDARHWGIFNGKAERWNGRLAMLGFAALIIDEAIRGSPFISCIIK